MATVSDMKYVEIANMRDEIDKLAFEINGIFDILSQSVLNSVKSHYEGVAADAYETKVRKYSTQVKNDLQVIINRINREINEQAEARKRQDAALSN